MVLVLSAALSLSSCLCSVSVLTKTPGGNGVRTPRQEHVHLSVPSVFVQQSMHGCLWIYAQCIVHTHVCVCAFISGVTLPFPAPSMFKASSCAVRVRLSLFSEITCSAFYQRAELGGPGTVQGWARIIKHQQILIHPDWNWLGPFAGLVWLGLVGHGGITALRCGGLVLLGDWRPFVGRWNCSWY